MSKKTEIKWIPVSGGRVDSCEGSFWFKYLCDSCIGRYFIEFVVIVIFNFVVNWVSVKIRGDINIFFPVAAVASIFVFSCVFVCVEKKIYHQTQLQNHTFFHRLRNNLATCERRLRIPRASQNTKTEHIMQFVDDVCQDIADCFKNFHGLKKIECSLRVANVDEDGNCLYVTCGHSKNLRHRRSTELPGNVGVALLLAQTNEKGRNVLFVPSIAKAIEKGEWYKLSSDGEDKDIKSALVLPINIRQVTTESNPQLIPNLFGILYFTFSQEKQKNPLTQAQIEFAAAIADGLAWSLQCIKHI